MGYGRDIPPDTQNQIIEFIENAYVGNAAQAQAADAIDRELEKVATNPRLGASRPGGPFESRRIYRFGLNIGDEVREVEVAYKISEKSKVVVFSGFHEVKSPL